MSSSDILLVERWIRRRDADAFNEIVLRYSALVYGTCRRVLRNHADAEEVTQDCFLHLARASSPPSRSLGGWLHALATHRALDRLKAKARRRRHEGRFAAFRETAEAPDWEAVQRFVDEAIEALPDELRPLIVAHFLEQRSQESIAREFGISRQTVSYRIARGIEKVRSRLARRGVNVVLASLSTMLSAQVVEAAPAGLKAALGKIALAGESAVGASAGTAGAATTLKLLGGIGAMYKIATAATIAVIILLFIGYGLSPDEEVVSSPPGGAGGLTIAVDAGEGDGLAGTEPAVDGARAEEGPPAASIDREKVIRGRVVDGDGRGVADATVAGGEKGGDKLTEAMADASGNFELAFPEAGSYAVCAFRIRVGLGVAYEVETGGEERAIKLEPLASVSGRVSDKESGEGIDAVELSMSYFGSYQDPGRARVFRWLDVGRSPEPERGPDGHYRFADLLANRYLFKLEAKGVDYVVPGTFGQPFVELVLMKGEVRTGFDFALERAGAVSGRVFGPDGKPLAGARARVASSKHSFSSPPSVTADDQGGYRIGGLAVGGSYAVIVDFEGLAQGNSETISMTSPLELTGLDVHMSEGHTVSGRIVDDDGNGIPGARFRLSKKYWSSSVAFGREETVAAEDGSFRIDRVGPGEYSLVPRAEGYESWSVLGLTMPADRDLNDQVFVLNRKTEGFVSGRVTDGAGRPLERVRLTIGNDRRGPHVQGESYTDDDGRYRFDGIGKAKTFMIGVHTQDYCYEEREQVPLNATDVNFTLERLASVIGRVVDDRTGEPVTDFEVRAVSYRNRAGGIPDEQWKPRHSESGEFILDSVEPPESTIEIRAEGYAPFVSERVRIAPEETIELDLRLQEGARLSGRVVDAATGAPLSGVRLRVYERNYFHTLLMTDRRETLAGGFHALTTTDQKGRFDFTGLSPDKELDLVAWSDGLGTQVFQRLRAPRRQEIRMHPEGRLVAEVRRGADPATGILVGVSLNERYYGADYWNGIWISAQGHVEHAGLRPGRYKVFVTTRDDERLGTFDQEIRAGETVNLAIDLEDLEKRFARIEGTIAGLAENVSLYLAPADDPERIMESTYCTPEKTSFNIGGIPPGEYILGATREESKRSTEQAITLRAGEELKVELRAE